MAVSIDEIKRLKALTGIGLTDAKAALVEADGDFDKALESLRKKGLTKAEKKGEREARQGIVDSYVHSERIGVILEVNCETDFVARTEGFKAFVHDIAMHIAANNPITITSDEISHELVEKEREIWRAQLNNEGKTQQMIENILVGKENKFREEASLMKQPFVKNPEVTVEQLFTDFMSKMGENIKVVRFSRFSL